jgi:hypothetical protein
LFFYAILGKKIQNSFYEVQLWGQPHARIVGLVLCLKRIHGPKLETLMSYRGSASLSERNVGKLWLITIYLVQFFVR